jgi:hypothetical protein
MKSTQNLDLWEAWIDKQIIGSQPHNMLYVVGEVFADKKSNPTLVKKQPQAHPGQLHLEIISPHTSIANIEEVYFSEIFQKDCPYKEILVFSNNSVVAAIKEIETIESI